MIIVREVTTKKQQREFLKFPLELYRDNPYFVPPLWSDEKKIFDKDFVYNDTCRTVFFNAYKDGKMAGRISGIVQSASNAKNNEKRMRFTRFDCIDDAEVAEALFTALEESARRSGMDTVCGPLGYSDLEREGLLVEGFDQLSTFEEQYNAEYYGRLIEHCGYRKEVDWTEHKLYLPDEDDGSLEKMADFVMKRYELHIGESKNVNDFIKKYADAFFELLDIGYKDIYGTVPFTRGMKDMMIANFKMIVDIEKVAVLLDKNGELAALGICFPSIAKAVRPSRGHLTPAALVRLLKAIKKPRVIDLGLVAVHPDYINCGVTAVICSELMKIMKNGGIEYAETNLNLEDNASILNMWKRFRAVQHKRRRSYVKVLDQKKGAGNDQACN